LKHRKDEERVKTMGSIQYIIPVSEEIIALFHKQLNHSHFSAPLVHPG
jgi:hypothetical protein